MSAAKAPACNRYMILLDALQAKELSKIITDAAEQVILKVDQHADEADVLIGSTQSGPEQA